MKYWTITDKSTGEVLYPSFITNGAHPADAGWAAKDNHKFIEIEKAPDLTCEFWDGEKWTPDLQVLQDRLWAKVKEIREAKEFTPIQTTIGEIQIDRQSRERLKDETERAIALAENNPDFKTQWLTTDNEVKDVTPEDLISLNFQIVDYRNKVFKRSQQLRKSIYKPKVTLEELQALNVEAGWPPEEAEE